jgi:hypothetical protein
MLVCFVLSNLIKWVPQVKTGLNLQIAKKKIFKKMASEMLKNTANQSFESQKTMSEWRLLEPSYLAELFGTVFRDDCYLF